MAPVAHGVVLWFQVDDFEAAVERARGLGTEIIEGPIFNPAPRHMELWLRDPDGYVVVVASAECGWECLIRGPKRKHGDTEARREF